VVVVIGFDDYKPKRVMEKKLTMDQQPIVEETQ